MLYWIDEDNKFTVPETIRKQRHPSQKDGLTWFLGRRHKRCSSLVTIPFQSARKIAVQRMTVIMAPPMRLPIVENDSGTRLQFGYGQVKTIPVYGEVPWKMRAAGMRWRTATMIRTSINVRIRENILVLKIVTLIRCWKGEGRHPRDEGFSHIYRCDSNLRDRTTGMICLSSPR